MLTPIIWKKLLKDLCNYQSEYILLTDVFAGNFKTFVKDMTIDPGMLRYLNGYLNTKTAPDENYARELQELFTMGKGKDVKKEEKKVPTKTAKEKKAEKRDKKPKYD